MTKGFFITGTNTGIGKTYVTGLLAKLFLEAGHTVVTQKIVQSGKEDDDIATHLSLMGKTKETYTPFLKAMCPYSLDLPASPHLSALNENTTISLDRIKTAYQALAKHFDIVLSEGVGGFLCPYTYEDTLASFPVDLDLPVILVAGNVLGGINHTLLTIEAIQSRGCHLAGIIFNTPEKDVMPLIEQDNPKVIESLSNIPILGHLAYTATQIQPEQALTTLLLG